MECELVKEVLVAIVFQLIIMKAKNNFMRQVDFQFRLAGNEDSTHDITMIMTMTRYRDSIEIDFVVSDMHKDCDSNPIRDYLDCKRRELGSISFTDTTISYTITFNYKQYLIQTSNLSKFMSSILLNGLIPHPHSH